MDTREQGNERVNPLTRWFDACPYSRIKSVSDQSRLLSLAAIDRSKYSDSCRSIATADSAVNHGADFAKRSLLVNVTEKPDRWIFRDLTLAALWPLCTLPSSAFPARETKRKRERKRVCVPRARFVLFKRCISAVGNAASAKKESLVRP